MDKQKSFSVNDENFGKTLLDSFPLVFPLCWAFHLLDFNILLSDSLESTRPADALGSLNFIASDHPNFNVCTFQGLYCRFEFFLKLVFDSRDS